MRAALLEEPKASLIVADDIELAPPGVGEVEVRITHAGVCHTDLSYIEGRIEAPYPIVLGHEVSGVVERLGPAVAGLAEGAKVVLTSRPPCGRCYWCVRGEVQLCAESTALLAGTYADGGTRLSRNGQVVYRGFVLAGFAERTVVPAGAVIPVPEHTDLSTAAILGCAVLTGVGAALNTAKVSAGSTVMVVGLGGVGMSIIQGSRIAGASRIIGIDPVAGRREQALHFGATDVADPTEIPAHQLARELTGGVGVDYGFDAVGRSSIVESLLKGIRRGGMTVVVGLPRADERFSVGGLGLNLYEKKLIGCYLGSADPRREYGRLLGLADAGLLDLAAMVTDRRPFSEINEAFDDMRAGHGIRTVLEMERP
jgi:S-(hydroxymethyl)glutathione dehydrogenase / alcohol dehydrogenase